MEKRWWMYAVGWGLPFVVVAISAGYGLSTDKYIEKLPAKIPKNPCSEGQILYPPLDTNLASKIFLVVVNFQLV